MPQNHYPRSDKVKCAVGSEGRASQGSMESLAVHALASSDAMSSAASAAANCDAHRPRMLRSRRGLGAVMKLWLRLQGSQLATVNPQHAPSVSPQKHAEVSMNMCTCWALYMEEGDAGQGM